MVMMDWRVSGPCGWCASARSPAGCDKSPNTWGMMIIDDDFGGDLQSRGHTASILGDHFVGGVSALILVSFCCCLVAASSAFPPFAYEAHRFITHLGGRPSTRLCAAAIADPSSFRLVTISWLSSTLGPLRITIEYPVLDVSFRQPPLFESCCSLHRAFPHTHSTRLDVLQATRRWWNDSYWVTHFVASNNHSSVCLTNCRPVKEIRHGGSRKRESERREGERKP